MLKTYSCQDDERETEPISHQWPRWTIICLAAGFLMSQTGCGTFLSRAFSDEYYSPQDPPPNLAQHHITHALYSGITFDVKTIRHTKDYDVWVLLLDLPCSFIADTLLLPLTIYEDFLSGWGQKAALEGDSEYVLKKLANGMDVNETDWQGHTVLMAAAWGGHLELVKALLEKGADAKIYSQSGKTAWHYAQRWEVEQPQIAQLLENSGGRLHRIRKSYAP